ncbi:MAG: PilT/PilU family type 4a pilus ATPase [Kiritimatiellales bacterium]|nr:PilT/PilU family type 4a pilus ATPase [Kiritimatiellales bacterium]
MNAWKITDLLSELLNVGGSDLLLAAGSTPQVRINGYLEPVGSAVLAPADTEAMAHEILSDEQIRILKTVRSVDLSKSYSEISKFRFNVYYQRGCVSIAARIIPPVIPSYKELGIPEVVMDFAEQRHGLVLITGPAGAGKSTTLATMVDHINKKERLHIITVEDPIEYVHAHRLSLVDQREIGSDALSFGDALRSIFRQSPDVIMIGEMRDLETMQLALTLAETGHLILATLHTQDTTHAINRIVDLFPPQQQQQVYVQLSLVLLGVVSQQLVATKDGSRRVLACEILKVNNAIRNLIRETNVQQIYSVIQSGQQEGMVTMNESLRHLWSENIIHEHAALQKTARPQELLRIFGEGNAVKGRK